jgi:exodeoxyribonuclease-3
MRVLTLNCNGIRAASRKGLFEWLKVIDADVIKLQEVRAELAILEKVCHLEGYYSLFNPAQKKGYSGTAILSKKKPSAQCTKIGIDTIDNEGRWCEATIEKTKFISLYLPSGSSGDEAQARKDVVLEKIQTHLQEILEQANQQNTNIIISGDWNIAHTEKDIKNWRGNLKNSGFLPHEREWLTVRLQDWVDVYRSLHPETEGEGYTWWSNRGQAYQNNTGWRIDYQIASPQIASCAKEAIIYKEQRFSDHAPLIVDYQF